MAIRLNDVDPSNAPGMVNEWWFGPRAFFMRSRAYEILTRELQRYLVREIRGRSFLIAAHRGVGKTSLVLRAVEDLARASLRTGTYGADTVSAGPPGRRPALLRPLLVKLHAAALVTPPKHDTWVAPQGNAAEKPSAETALQQIAIALYRALAGEIAEAFTLHAREATGRRGSPDGDLLELAAQLTLDLDLAPDIAALREYWRRIGRLGSGVLWPDPISQQMISRGLADRGMCEIVALATANQAFQVCAGRVEASQSSKGAAERSARIETAARIDGKDVTNKLFGLTAGALVGGALLPTAGGGTAAAAGLGTALLGTFALNWSSDRRQRSERSTDYTFIMDRSLQTLDRDLPVVIERIREAGLAPVFLIDELDKLQDPGSCIEAITRRLKSLTTDYGFFCFLTDRDYFEEIEEKLRVDAYPSEHTLFSHRLLLLYRPAELARYVRELWTIDPAQPNEGTAAWVLTCVALHGAHLNAADLRRELARLCDENGNLKVTPFDVLNSGQYLVPMAVQLAIEHVLGDPDISRRVESDDAFAQLAIDVLYMISRAWKDGKPEIVVNEAAVRQYLVERRCPDGDRDAAEQALSEAVSPGDVTRLTARALQLARLLTRFSAIYEAIYAEERAATPLPTAPLNPPFSTTKDSEGAKLIALASLLTSIPGVPSGLLEDTAYPDDSDTFRFSFDRYGVAYTDWNLTLQAVKQAVSLLDGLRDGLAAFGMDIAVLVSAGVLPTNLDQTALEQSVARLRGSQSIAAIQLAQSVDINRLTGAFGAIQRRAVITIVAFVRWVVEGTVLTAPVVLAAIDRMLGIAPLVAALSARPGAPAPVQSLKSPNARLVDGLLEAPAAPDDIEDWRGAITAEVDRLKRRLSEKHSQVRIAASWEERVAGWLLRGERPVNPPIDEGDIVDAAEDVFPAAQLRPDFDTMTITEWSRFTVMAFARRTGDGEAWMFVAGLRALGFGESVLQAAGGGRFADGAAADRPGLWLVFAPGAEIIAPPDPAAIPMLSIPRAEENSYMGVRDWLIENGALAAATRIED